MPLPTKYTAVYVTYEGQKSRAHFSENLALKIMNFSLILAINFPKKKNSESSEKQKLKYNRNFQLTNRVF